MLVALFLALGTAEVFADTTASTLLPMLVDKRDLGIANARMQAGFLTANQLVGPAIGAAAVRGRNGAGRSCSQIVCVAARRRPDLADRYAAAAASARDVDSHIRQDIAEGVRWLWQHAAGPHAGADRS